MTWKAPPGWKKLRAKVFATKGRQCWWCGAPAGTVDHVIPAALGGAHTLDNLVPACSRCNYGRGASLGGRIISQRRHGYGPAGQTAWPSARRW